MEAFQGFGGLDAGFLERGVVILLGDQAFGEGAVELLLHLQAAGAGFDFFKRRQIRLGDDAGLDLRFLAALLDLLDHLTKAVDGLPFDDAGELVVFQAEIVQGATQSVVGPLLLFGGFTRCRRFQLPVRDDALGAVTGKHDLGEVQPPINPLNLFGGLRRVARFLQPLDPLLGAGFLGNNLLLIGQRLGLGEYLVRRFLLRVHLALGALFGGLRAAGEDVLKGADDIAPVLLDAVQHAAGDGAGLFAEFIKPTTEALSAYQIGQLGERFADQTGGAGDGGSARPPHSRDRVDTHARGGHHTTGDVRRDLQRSDQVLGPAPAAAVFLGLAQGVQQLAELAAEDVQGAALRRGAQQIPELFTQGVEQAVQRVDPGSAGAFGHVAELGNELAHDVAAQLAGGGHLANGAAGAAGDFLQGAEDGNAGVGDAVQLFEL